MHVFGISLDLSWFLQFILTLFLIALGLLHLVKNTASKYFVVDDTFDPPSPDNHTSSFRKMPGRPAAIPDPCAVCGNSTTKNCGGCKAVRYCSTDCQRSHWNSGHKQKCKDLGLSRKVNPKQPISLNCGRWGSEAVPSIGNTKITKPPKEILFPYEEFVDLFNWNKPGFPPCGLLNCGNSCFANVVLQCLSHTRPLVAYLLEKGHRGECRRTDWCFLCELQTHVERASNRRHPFSPLNILSRLPNIGGNLGYGKQEDAHEFMRFAIDTMQSVCLDEFGGEKAIHPSTQETTLIQHIFGGHLESQVICTKCNNISKQYENMMDLTVEIQGDADSLEECLDQFTAREQLHGDNMYKCDGCNDYVMAWKRLTIRRAPNILTIALKRFQSGRFGKLNKRVTFPETLDLSPYMSEAGHENDVYKLYAVVVHVDMLNASYFGHYICYIKDFCGNWYMIDDCKVIRADLEEVLSQGAYMLLYSRVCARPSCLKPIEGSSEEQKTAEVVQEEPSAEQSAEGSTTTPSTTSALGSGSLPSDNNSSEEQKTAEVVQEEASAEGSTTTPSITSALGSGSLPTDSNSYEEQKIAEVVPEESSAEGTTMTPSFTSALASGSLPPDSNLNEEHKTAEVVQEEASDEGSTMTPSITSALGSGSLPTDSNSNEEQKIAEVVQEEPSAEGSTMTPLITSALASGSLPFDSNSSEEPETAEVVQEEPSAECSTMNPSITSAVASGSLQYDSNSCPDGCSSKMELSSTSHSEGSEQDTKMVDSDTHVSSSKMELSSTSPNEGLEQDTKMVDSDAEVSSSKMELSATSLFEVSEQDTKRVETDPSPSAMDIEVYGNGCLNLPEENSPVRVLPCASETLKPEAGSNGSAFYDTNNGESSGRELTGSPSESSMPVQNGMLCQKSEVSEDDLNPTGSTLKPEGKAMGNTSSVKSSARAKSKPLFPRGFLEKPPPIKCMKREGKSPSQHVPSGDVSNGGTSEGAKPGSVLQNGFLTKEKRKTNGTVESVSGKIANLHNGHSGALVSPPDEGGLSNMDTDNNQTPVEQSLERDGSIP